MDVRPCVHRSVCASERETTNYLYFDVMVLLVWIWLNNKRNNKMIKDLVSLANHLDARGFRKEADYLDGIITKLSGDYPEYEVAKDDDLGMPSDYEIKGMLQLYDERQVGINDVFNMLNRRGIARNPAAIAPYLNVAGISKGSESYGQIIERAEWNRENSN